MSEEILKRIDALAAKLNTTAAQIWDVYVAQAKIEAIQTLVYAVFVAVAIYCLFRYWRWAIKIDEDGCFIGGVFLSIAVCAAFVVVLIDIGNLPTMLLNPQYWALKQIMGAISK